MGERRRFDAPVRCPTAYTSHYATCLAPAAEPARVVRMNEPTAMLIDQVPGHLLAGVRGLNSAIAGGAICYGVNNDVPGRAQNGIGAASTSLRRVLSSMRWSVLPTEPP